MIDSDTKREVIGKYLSAHSAGDIEGIISLFASDASAWDPVGSDPHVGTEALREFFTGTHAMADSLELVSTGPIRCVADQAAFPMTAKTQIGEMTLEIDIIDVMAFNDSGEIVEMRAYWDMADARTGSV